MAVTIKSKEEIQCMRDAGKILAEVHEKLAEIIAPGITSLEIDRKGEELIRNAGCIPSFKGYEGYPASICVSINDEVVHGIPSKEHHLFDGDIVSLDAGVIYKGYQSDAARTHGVGTIDAEAKRLIEVTKESFFRGIAFAKAGNRLYDILDAPTAMKNILELELMGKFIAEDVCLFQVLKWIRLPFLFRRCLHQNLD
mgnify:CR=1 FL=1